MNHVMLDIETFGVRPWSVIRSIGAVSFDLRTGDVTSEFYQNIDEKSCEEAGLVAEKKVKDWWARQSEDAQKAFLHDQVPLADGLMAFSEWFIKTGAQVVWCQGTAFDIPIMTTAYEFVGNTPPWNFRKVRDTRTAYHVLGFDPDSVPRDGVYHSAVDDCKHQVKCLRKAISG